MYSSYLQFSLNFLARKSNSCRQSTEDANGLAESGRPAKTKRKSRFMHEIDTSQNNVMENAPEHDENVVNTEEIANGLSINSYGSKFLLFYRLFISKCCFLIKMKICYRNYEYSYIE